MHPLYALFLFRFFHAMLNIDLILFIYILFVNCLLCSLLMCFNWITYIHLCICLSSHGCIFSITPHLEFWIQGPTKINSPQPPCFSLLKTLILYWRQTLLTLSVSSKSMDNSVHVEYNGILVIILYKLASSIEIKNVI